ncbi:MAG TPA: carboxypeptidase-like regulatory domain-containing protein [Bryobacteraceae bacterium]|nr:carboxypeptidase-like regulatory domain-containing protein [Bryobacteraceae bacterium]
MRMCKATQLFAMLALLVLSAFGQTVSSSLVGTVLDPASAVVPNAKVTLTDPDTGSVRTVTTDVGGNFRFLDLSPGTYTLSVQVQGFKGLTETNVVVAAQETRDIGKITLQVGSLSESVSVMAEATPIQLASSEKSQGIDANQLKNVTLKGRDMFGYMSMVPGVIDTTASRDVTTPNAIGGIIINGNESSKINFTVDGITDLDTGSNSTVHYEPNIDAIQELKVLTSNYQAEFGRNSGGTITAVTKSGTRDLHATGQWTHRHEEFNANSWLNNHSLTATGTAQPIPRYRYNIESYTVGGPAYIPRLLNKGRNKLFFFWAQEYTGQFVTGGAQTKYTPTALERGGDFSQTFANNGSLVVVTDPNTGAPFPGNKVPASRADPTGVGQQMLNFFPLPNFVGTGNQANVVNYFESASATHPRRNDVLRLDTYVTSKINGYFRWINDHDDMIALYQGVQFSQDKGGVLGANGIAPIDHPNPGHGYSGTVTYAITPTLINEFSIGESWNTWAYYSTDNYKTEDRSLISNIPTLFPIPTQNPTGVSVSNGYLNLLPQFQFGSPPSNSMSYTRNQTSAGNEENFNTIWTWTDNLSKVVGGHSFKAGVYLERNAKLQPGSNPYSGSFNFSPDSNNALYNTGNGYANAFLGYVDVYQQATARATFNVHYWNAEFYVQDNWRVNRKLTLDLGVRFYHQPSQNDVNLTFANFFPNQYQASAAPRVYGPGMSGGKRVAIDPGTGAVAPVAYIGLYVPGSGNPADGFALLGKNGVSLDTYNISAVKAAPRIGFAYDVSGDGKTAVRGGFGVFYNRLDGNQVYNLAGQPPYGYTPQLNYTTMTAIGASGGSLIFGPQTYYAWPQSQIPWNGARNASIDVQRSVFGTVVDIGYTGNWSYNQNLSYNINAIPIGTRFLPANADPTNGGKPLPDILMRTIYPGFNTINQYAEIGNTNFNALTASAQRRLSNGLAFQVAYTYSKNLGTISYTPVVPNNDEWNYGRLASDRRHHLVVNYSYDLPKASKHLGRFVGVFADYWVYSGVMVSSSGGPFNPGIGFASGSLPDYTGTPDVSARPLIVGNPMANIPAGAYFNPAAIALPALGTSSPATPVLGDLGGGSGVLSYPHYTNFDMTMSKRIPIGLGEHRGLRLQVQAYNVFNHTEVSSLNTTVQLNPATNAVVNPLQAGTASGTFPNRILAFGLRFDY